MIKCKIIFKQVFSTISTKFLGKNIMYRLVRRCIIMHCILLCVSINCANEEHVEEESTMNCLTIAGQSRVCVGSSAFGARYGSESEEPFGYTAIIYEGTDTCCWYYETEKKTREDENEPFLVAFLKVDLYGSMPGKCKVVTEEPDPFSWSYEDGCVVIIRSTEVKSRNKTTIKASSGFVEVTAISKTELTMIGDVVFTSSNQEQVDFKWSVSATSCELMCVCELRSSVDGKMSKCLCPWNTVENWEPKGCAFLSGNGFTLIFDSVMKIQESTLGAIESL